MKGSATGLNTIRRMVAAKTFYRARRSVFWGVIALFWAVGAYAAQSAEPAAEPTPVSYASVSDQELTDIAARWDDLDAQQRRAVLSEVKMRMKRNGTAQGVLRVKVGRRYGTVVRRADGTTATLRIEVRSVRKGSQGFGVGFERRAQQGDMAPEEAEPNAPVIRVADPE